MKITIKEKLEDLCIQNGLSPNETKSIIEVFYKSADNELKSRWNEDAGDYPPAIIGILWYGVKRCALAWIIANKPQHWAKPMFDGTAEAKN